MKALCFTGHRPNKLGGYSGAKAIMIQNNIQDKLVDVIIRAYHNGFDTFISGSALGVDQFVANAVLHVRDVMKLPIKLIMALPFPSQGCKWPEKSQAYLRKLCSQADLVKEVSPDPYTREKMQIRNEWMVDNSAACCAVSNGAGGGTGNCIKYAQSKFKPVLIINPYTLVEGWLRHPVTVKW